ncbi:hypothetical protein ABH940_005570 [Streptacidiphilus sp. BW17]|uniref:hypothetical protein n=1 Tax=Streptacidiphilus sp. BW17 TaxID=3156274 RepID=UPI0035136E1E
MTHPDFELYDNAGRTTAQIHSYNTGEPTDEDVARQHESAVRDRAGLSRLPGDSGRSLGPWTELLLHAESAGDLAAVLDLVGTDDNGAAVGLHDFLEAAAQRADEIPGGAKAAHKLRKLSDQMNYISGRLNGISYDLFRLAPTEVPLDSLPRGTSPAEPSRKRNFHVAQDATLLFTVHAVDEDDAWQQVREMEGVQTQVDVPLGGGFVLDDVVFGDVQDSTITPVSGRRSTAATSTTGIPVAPRPTGAQQASLAGHPPAAQESARRPR